jgi:hypothetical protein
MRFDHWPFIGPKLKSIMPPPLPGSHIIPKAIERRFGLVSTSTFFWPIRV